MAVGRVWDIEWLHHNGLRKYPLMDTVSAQDQSDTFTIPDSFILDLCFPVVASDYTTPGQFHIKQLASYSSGYVVTIGYNGDAIASFSVPSASHTPFAVYPVIGQGEFANSTGQVAIGSLANIDLQPAGVFVFDMEDATIQPRCIIPAVEGINGIRVLSGGVLSDLMTNVITLEGGANCRLRVDPSEDDNIIYIDAIGNEDFLTDCVCEGQRDTGTPIRTINGISPTSAGDFTLQGSTCLNVSGISNGVKVVDVCSQPCCGCEELQVIQNALITLQNQQYTLQQYASRLQAAATGMNTIVTQTFSRMPQTPSDPAI